MNFRYVAVLSQDLQSMECW